MQRLVRSIFALGVLPLLLLIALCARWRTRKIDVGLGPVPLINNVYHKKALATYGYTSETFVNNVYYITDEFDVRGDRTMWGRVRLLRVFFLPLYLLIRALYTYKCLYVYFNGGPLGHCPVLWRVEPVLYKLAHVKVVVMAYGGDVQELSRSANLLFKDAMAHDYPSHRLRRQLIAARIDLWTRWADHIISGCEWVDYLYYWHTLMLAHFSIDVDRWRPSDRQVSQVSPANQRQLRILHAPNHRTIKGTQYFINAVNELVAEGLAIELVILERVPNHKVREVMAAVDVVADQLIIGWYAMFALEAMAMAKPVLCYLRPDLEELYIGAGLVGVDEIPIVRCSPFTVKECIRELALHRAKLCDIGKRSRQFVLKHHSPQTVGKVFDRINRSLGINPGALVDHVNTPGLGRNTTL
jgi:glycosyltransferase involved in cell wall biosynthesis